MPGGSDSAKRGEFEVGLENDLRARNGTSNESDDEGNMRRSGGTIELGETASDVSSEPY